MTSHGGRLVVRLLFRPAGRDGEETDGLRHVVRADERGRAFFPHLEPGAYEVALCADEDCREHLTGWEAVEVRAGEDSRIALSNGAAEPERAGP